MSTWREIWHRNRSVPAIGIVAIVIVRGKALFRWLYSVDAYFVAKKSWRSKLLAIRLCAMVGGVIIMATPPTNS